MNLFSFFYPRRPNERKTREKPKKKDLSEFLECLTKFCPITFFLFPPSEKFTPIRGLKYMGFGFAGQPSI
jgi:hypothetical protein